MEMDMEHVSIIPAHSLADWLLDNIDGMLDALGLEHHQVLEQIIYFIIITAASWFIGWVLKKIIVLVTRKVLILKHSSEGGLIIQMHTLSKCTQFIPPLVFVSLAPFAFESRAVALTVIVRIGVAYTIMCIALGIAAVFDVVFTHYDRKENTKNLPIRGILNVGKGIVWGIAAIIAISVLVHRSPAVLLTGLGAFAAALMLIFKDSILGFVAGIQMSQNDMLHVGDWIVVPGTPANGNVMSVSLTTVKVQNFDNTIVWIPPYTLVSTSFQNWRSVISSGSRRVMMSVHVNPDSICFASAAMLTDLGGKYPALQTFINGLQEKKETIAWNAGKAPLNGTIETNLGLYRAYIVSYLLASPMVNANYDLMVSMQPMTPEGVPMQVYFFTATSQWEAYEGIRAGIMEHMLAVAPDFGLEILSGDHLNIDTHNAQDFAVAPANNHGDTENTEK